MTLTIIILTVLVLVFVSLFLLEKSKFNRLLKEFVSDDRIGYYDSNGIYLIDDPNGRFYCRIFVKELEKYTNGMSKIELQNIEVINYPANGNNYIADVKLRIKNQFSILKKTSDIEWLEPTKNIKQQRREKLEQIKKHTK